METGDGQKGSLREGGTATHKGIGTTDEEDQRGGVSDERSLI